jgi:hypothetical protein
MNRPDRITLISIGHWVAAAFWLLCACALITVPVIVGLSREGQAATVIVSIITFVGIAFLLLLAAGCAVVGWGLWQLKPWARFGAIVLSGIFGLLLFPVGTVIGGLVIWYLFLPEALQAFGETTS